MSRRHTLPSVRAIVALTAFVASLAARAPAHGQDARAETPMAGTWLATMRVPNRGELAIRLTVEAIGDQWRAYSRPHALREMTGWAAYTFGRLTRKTPPMGAAVYLSGERAWSGGPPSLAGRLASPMLGTFHVRGTVRDGRIALELRRDSLGAVVGTIDAVPLAMGARDRPLRDYRALADSIRRVLGDWAYDPRLVERADWRDALARIARRMAAAVDDADALLAFYANRARFHTSHLELTRDPSLVDIPLDSLAARVAGPPDSLVTLRFLAPGVAYLYIRKFDRVTPAVDRAFQRIDSAKPHTLVLDIRGNSGGDHSSMSPLAHLVRDSVYVGAFVANKWYRAHAAPPTAAQRRTLPTTSRDGGVEILELIRAHGAVAGVAPPRAPYFGGDVYLLTNRGSGSASEPLAHMLKLTRRATLVGEPTAGAMLTGLPHSVGQGWVMVVPEADFYAADGTRLEGVGVAPDVAVPWREALVPVAERVRARDAYAGAVLLGVALASVPQWPRAEAAYREAVRQWPDSAQPAYGLLGALSAQQKYADGLALAERFAAAHPAETGMLFQVGRFASLAAERLEQGEAALRAYIARGGAAGHGTLASAHARLGRVLELRGRRDEARQAYETALRLDPMHADATAWLRALDGGR